MGKIVSFISEHKYVLLAGIVVVVVVVALILVAQCTIFRKRNQPEQHAKTAPEVSTPSSCDVKNSATYSDLQKTLTARYGTREHELIQNLKTYLWVSQTGCSVQFEDDAYIVKGSNDMPSWKSFAVSALSGQDIINVSQGGTDTVEPCIVAILFSDNTTKILSITPVTIGDRKTFVMTTDAFGSKISYTAQRQKEDIHFEGFSEEVNRTLEKDTKDLKDAVANYIKTNFPTASVATLNTKITFDFSTHAVSLSFALNDVKKSKIRVMWHRESNRTEFSRGGG